MTGLTLLISAPFIRAVVNGARINERSSGLFGRSWKPSELVAKLRDVRAGAVKHIVILHPTVDDAAPLGHAQGYSVRVALWSIEPPDALVVGDYIPIRVSIRESEITREFSLNDVDVISSVDGWSVAAIPPLQREQQRLDISLGVGLIESLISTIRNKCALHGFQRCTADFGLFNHLPQLAEIDGEREKANNSKYDLSRQHRDVHPMNFTSKSLCVLIFILGLSCATFGHWLILYKGKYFLGIFGWGVAAFLIYLAVTGLICGFADWAPVKKPYLFFGDRPTIHDRLRFPISADFHDQVRKGGLFVFGWVDGVVNATDDVEQYGSLGKPLKLSLKLILCELSHEWSWLWFSGKEGSSPPIHDWLGFRAKSSLNFYNIRAIRVHYLDSYIDVGRGRMADVLDHDGESYFSPNIVENNGAQIPSSWP